MIHYYFDENMSTPLANSINELAKVSQSYRVLTVKDLMGQVGADDKEIIEQLLTLQHQSVIISQDDDFKKRNVYPLNMNSKNLGLLHIKFPKGSKAWDQYKFMVNCWEKIRELSVFPFAYTLLGNKKLDKM